MRPLLLFVVLLLALTVQVQAQLTLLSPESGEYAATVSPAFSFKVGELPKNCSLTINSEAVKTTTEVVPNATVSMSYSLPDSAYNWSVICYTASATLTAPQRALTVDTQAPSVEVEKPVHNGKVNVSKVNFGYLPKESNLKSCTLKVKIGDKWTTMESTTGAKSNEENTFTAELIDGSYHWNVWCFDKANNSGSAVFERPLTVDTTPPKILSYTPFSVITEKSVMLTVITNEDATCRYSQNANATASQMVPFEFTEFTTHRHFLPNVGDGVNTYYLQCTDMLSNEMPLQKVKLDVHLLATAEITLSRSSPVSAGELTVTVKTSRDLQQPPEITYALEGQAPVQVPLVGSQGGSQGDSEWEGQIIIGSEPQKKLAKFTFSGKDTHGYVGTIITQGKTFIVDTQAPAAPLALKAELKQGYPFLSWHPTEGDNDIKTYQVYRSTSAGVTYADFYANTTATDFRDWLTQSKQTYYYRVAALDQADNRGPLSVEVVATALSEKAEPAQQEDQSLKEEEAPKPLPPHLVIRVNDKIKQVEAAQLSVNDAKASLNALDGERKRFAEELGLLKAAQASEAKLAAAIEKMNQIKTTYHSDSAVADELAKVDIEMTKALSSLAKRVEVEQQTEFVQDLTKENVRLATNELAASLGLAAGSHEDYVESTLQVLKDIKITGRVDILKVELIDGKTEKVTFVQKSISYRGEKPLEDVVVVELIPKTVAQSAREISYVTAVPEVLKDDPVLKWGFHKLGYDAQPLKYYIKAEVSLASVKDTVTVPLTQLNTLVTPKVTGLITSSVAKGSWQVALLILGTLGALGYYYFRPLSGAGSSNSNSIKSKKIKDPISYQLLRDINQKLISMKLEIDDLAHPLAAKVTASVDNKHDVSAGEVAQKLVESANQYLTAKQHEKAKSLYEAIALLYPSLPQDIKAKISGSCMQLREALQQQARSSSS